MTTITVNPTAKAVAPRGAAWAATAFSALLNWLYTTVERRAANRQLADRLEEATRVRLYAQQVQAQDPRFAADLFAAADRHERG